MSWDYRLDPPDEPELTDECEHCGTGIVRGDVFCSRACARAAENDGPREDE